MKSFDKVVKGRPLTNFKFKMNLTALLLIFTFFIVQANTRSVQLTIIGTVTDANDQPLAGASIVEKGTNNGTQTDFDGNFSIEVSDEDAVLLISYIGFASQEIAVNGKTQISVMLQESASGLDEVVVIGYGTTTKADLSSSVATVDQEVLENIRSVNLVDGLQGRLPGLDIKQQTGEPGSYMTRFNIRGFGKPLIVVDGIVRDDFGKLDPNSIQNVSVLKDAAASVYGVKAANGVVLITTKKGNLNEKPTLRYGSRVELNRVTDANNAQVSNAYEFATQIVETDIYLGRTPSYSPEDLQKYKDGTYPSTNWEDVAFNDYSWGINHNLSLSGGGKNVRYFNSLGFSYNGGLLKSGDLNYQKYNLTSNVTADISDNFKATLSIDGILETKTKPYTDQGNSTGYWHYTRMNKPTFSVYANDNPDYFTDFGYPYHPIAETTSAIGGYINRRQKTFQANLTLDYNVEAVDGLSLKTILGYYDVNSFIKRWRKKYSVYTYEAENDIYNETGVQNAPSRLEGDYSDYFQTTGLVQINYATTIQENHSIKAMLSFEKRHQKSDNLFASKQFAIDVDQFFADSSQNQIVNSSGLFEDDNQNLISRVNYNYSNKYLVQAGFNYGGSSKFPEGKRWGFFPFASAAWRISEEGFFKENVSFFNELKFRASWGQAGDDTASTFQFLTGYTYPDRNYVFNNQLINGIGFKGVANPNITWFTTTTKNIGVDADLFDNSLSMSVDLFRRDREGLLGTRSLSIPVSVGATLPQENLNSDIDKGFEFNVSYKSSIGEFKYNANLILTYTRSYFNHIDRPPSGNSYLNWRNNEEGRVKNAVFGSDYIGQFQSYDEILGSPIQDDQGNRTLSPGDLKYRDVNKDGIVDDLDNVVIGGNTTPEYNYSLNLALEYKKFYVDIFFQGAAKNNFQYRGYSLYANRWGRNSLDVFMDRWHHEDIYDPDSPLIPGHYPQTGAINNVPSNHWMSSFWYPDASLSLIHI